MHCVICRHGETRPGTTTVTFTRGHSTVVIRGVPADVCENCGEAYVSADVARRLLELADQIRAAGAEVAVSDYADAA
jgi:YgiT-type zinc finger domain-containing protein